MRPARKKGSGQDGNRSTLQVVDENMAGPRLTERQLPDTATGFI